MTNSQVVNPGPEQYFSGITWKRLLSRGVATTTLGRTWTRYATAPRDSLLVPILESHSAEGENTRRADVTWLAGNGGEIETGTICKYASDLRYDATLAGFTRRDTRGVPQPLRVDTSFSAWRNGTYLQAAWQAVPRLRLSVGVRNDWYGFLDNAVRFAPRVSASLRVDPVTTLTLAGGRNWQAPSYIWLVGDPQNAQRLKPFRADQVVAGVTRLVGSDVKVQLEVYGTRYTDAPARRFWPQTVLSPSGFDDAISELPC